MVYGNIKITLPACQLNSPAAGDQRDWLGKFVGFSVCVGGQLSLSILLSVSSIGFIWFSSNYEEELIKD